MSDDERWNLADAFDLCAFEEQLGKNRPPKYRRMCEFISAGRPCRLREDCPDAHSVDELDRMLWKKLQCRAYQNCWCPLSAKKCFWAHGPADVWKGLYPPPRLVSSSSEDEGTQEYDGPSLEEIIAEATRNSEAAKLTDTEKPQDEDAFVSSFRHDDVLQQDDKIQQADVLQQDDVKRVDKEDEA